MGKSYKHNDQHFHKNVRNKPHKHRKGPKQKADDDSAEWKREAQKIREDFLGW